MAIIINPLAQLNAANAGPIPTQPVTPQSVSSLYQLIGQASDLAAQSDAFTTTAAGDVSEASAYTSAGDIARANARLALVGGDIEQAQEGIKLGQTIGTQRAQVAGGGFASSGSALALLSSSTRQGLLQQQITGVNAQLQAGGFEEQAAASDAEAAAAKAAGNTATANAAHATSMSNFAKTFASATAASMSLNIPGVPTISSTSIPSLSDMAPSIPNQYSLGPQLAHIVNNQVVAG